MRKPNDWETTPVFGEYVPLELGGHVCKIMNVLVSKSRTGKDMLVIFLDIAEGDQKGYFAERYKVNTRRDKKWSNGATVYQLTLTEEGNTSPGYKKFIESVKVSNSDFNEDALWSDDDSAFCEYLKGRLVGAVFGREQYISQRTNEKLFATKVFRFCTVDEARAGIPAPADKLLTVGVNTSAIQGFNETADIDDDLPF